MNISKKAILSIIVALTSVVSMAQPYYHIMKEVNGKLVDDTGYNGKDYYIKIDMVENRPEDAIGGRISISEEFNCHISQKRSFYFTKNGNVYYDKTQDRFFFEESQLDYPRTYSENHIGHFNWGRSIKECTDRVNLLWWFDAKEEDFYFANPEYLPKLKEDLGNEEWAVLSCCEWSYVCTYLGECGWKVDGKNCFLIDATPDKSLLTELRNKNNGNTSNLSIEEFKSLEAQGLVCLPASGFFRTSSNFGWGRSGNYWSCTPSNDMTNQHVSGAYFMDFNPSEACVKHGPVRSLGYAVRLVVLAGD